MKAVNDSVDVDPEAVFPDEFSSKSVVYENGSLSLVHIEYRGGALCGAQGGHTTEEKRSALAFNVSECPACALERAGVEIPDDGSCPLCDAEPPARVQRKPDKRQRKTWTLDHLTGQTGNGCPNFDFDPAED